MADVFISYARRSADQARAAAEALRSTGYSVWLDEDLPAHRAYSRVIEDELNASKATLVIWSLDATRSEWVMSEANRAREARKLVQVTIDQAPLPMPFDQIQCADLRDWAGAVDAPGWRKALASISHLVGRAATPGITVAPAVVEPSVDPHGERRHLTFLSCGLAGAADIVRRIDPESWREIATAFQRDAEGVARRMGGHVTRTGGGLAVAFGYPEAQEDAAERAVRAGLAIVDAAKALGDRLGREHGVSVSAQVGIHAGTVVVSRDAAGGADMFGDAPNLAVHAQAGAAPGAVVITAAARELVNGLFDLEAADEQALRVGDAELGLRRVLRARPGPSRVSHSGPSTPFIGRGDELQLLRSRWARVLAGEGQLMLVTGEPGIGKTRLVEEFRASLGADEARWIVCGGAPLFANTPFHAVREMLNQTLGQDDVDAAARLERLAEILAPTGIKVAEALPLFAEMMHLPSPTAYPPLNLAPEERRQRLLAAMVTWVLSVTADQPLVIVVEDLQWIDPSTMEVVQLLADQGSTTRLLLLCTARPEFRAHWPPHGHHAQIALNRMDAAQTRELVTGLLARDGVEKALVDAVVKRTDGVPLFAEALSRFVRDEEPGAGPAEIPATLLDSLTARLDRVGRPREVAQLAAVIGREFSYPLLKAVSDLSEEELQSALAGLRESDLIHARGLPPNATYQFRHALIQDAAYEALLRSRRRELHGRVARAMIEQFPAMAEAQPEILALHWTRAGEAERAIAAWRAAGDSAYGRRAFKEAEAAYRQGLMALEGAGSLADRDARELDLLSALNRVLQLTRGYAAPETVEAAARARALAERSGSLSQLIREEAKIWRAVITTGDYAAATVLADHILDLARHEDDNPARLVFGLNAQVQTRFYTGDLRGVEAHFEQLSPLIDTVGPRQAPGNSVVAIGVATLTAWALGQTDVARARMARALNLAEASKNPYDLAMALHFMGNLCVFRRDAQGAEAAASQLLGLARANGFSYAASLAMSPLGWARATRGAASENAAEMRLALEDLARTGAHVGNGCAFNLLAETEALGGEPAHELATIEEALTFNPQERVFRPESLRIRGVLRIRTGDLRGGEDDLRAAIDMAREMEAVAWELRAATSLARLLRDGGETAAARDLLGPVVERLGEADFADLRDARIVMAG